jgi:hypothetical protein
MPKKTPDYRQRKDSEQAIVTLMDAVTRERLDYRLGTFGTPESRELYHRLIAGWEATHHPSGLAVPHPTMIRQHRVGLVHRQHEDFG